MLREQARGAGVVAVGGRRCALGSAALGAKAAAAVHGFMGLIERLAREGAGLALHEQVDQVLKASGLIEHYRREKAERGEARAEDLGRAGECRARLRARDERAAATRGLPRARGAGVGRGAGGRLGGLRADDDAAHGQGARVPRGVPERHGGGAVPAPALAQRPRRPRGGAAAVLCRHDARHAPAVPHLRGAAPPARRRQLRAGLALHP